jgi:hypothetical protein
VRPSSPPATQEELTRADEEGKATGGDPAAAEFLQRLITSVPLQGPYTPASRFMYEAALKSLDVDFSSQALRAALGPPAEELLKAE